MTKYDLIYTDPPWPQRKSIRKARPNQGRELDYKTMPLPLISTYHRLFLEEYAAPKHNVFMWTIDKFLFAAEEMMRELGYKLHARLIWDKTNGPAPAFTLRFTHEYLLWFYRPNWMLPPVPEMRGKFPTVIREASVRHSQKPDAVYQMLRELFPEARRIELFARRRAPGFDAIGDELEEKNEMA